MKGTLYPHMNTSSRYDIQVNGIWNSRLETIGFDLCTSSRYNTYRTKRSSSSSSSSNVIPTSWNQKQSSSFPLEMPKQHQIKARQQVVPAVDEDSDLRDSSCHSVVMEKVRLDSVVAILSCCRFHQGRRRDAAVPLAGRA